MKNRLKPRIVEQRKNSMYFRKALKKRIELRERLQESKGASKRMPQQPVED
jgi:hypothetical protein